jgi:hypothetical protein
VIRGASKSQNKPANYYVMAVSGKTELGGIEATLRHVREDLVSVRPLNRMRMRGLVVRAVQDVLCLDTIQDFT